MMEKERASEREPLLFLLSSAISNNVGLNGAKVKACLLLYMCLYVLPRHRRRCLHDVTCKFRLDAARLVDVSARFPESAGTKALARGSPSRKIRGNRRREKEQEQEHEQGAVHLRDREQIQARGKGR